MSLKLTPYINILDKSFKEANTRSYVLSMQISLHGLTFCILNPEKNKFIGLQAFHFPNIENESQLPSLFGQILNEQPWFAFPYKEVTVLLANRFSTPIPQALFDAQHKHMFLGFNHPFQENSRILYDQLKNIDACMVYYASNPVVEKIKDFWANAKILHFSTALTESLAIINKNKYDRNTLFLQVHDNSFDLVHFNEKNLNFYNKFAFNTKEDFIYFLLLGIEQLALNPEKVNLVMMGKVDKVSPYYEMIYRYIKNFKVIEKNNNFQYSYLFDQINLHHHYILFNSLLCE